MQVSSLFAVDLFGLLLCAVALVMNTVGARTVRIPTMLVLCSLSGAAGMSLLLLFGRIDNFYTAVVANFFIQMSFVFMYRGYSWMTGLPANNWLMRGWLLLLASTIIGTCAMTWAVYYANTIVPGLLIFSAGVIIGSVVCIVLLMRVPSVFLREASWLSITCLSLFVVANVVRSALVLLHTPPPGYFHRPDVVPGVLLINTIALAGLTYGHVWITGARQRIVLQAQAYTDELTGVLNRRALTIEAEREISRSRRNKQPLAVILCDLDNFKSANDTLGHNYGDSLLRAASNALRSVLRREDLIARLGGDEFVIMLPGTSRQRALEVAERLRAEIQRLYVPNHGRHIGLCASFGVAILDAVPDDSWEALLQRTDDALYAAKNVGGNQIVMGPGPQVLQSLQNEKVQVLLDDPLPSTGTDVVHHRTTIN